MEVVSSWCFKRCLREGRDMLFTVDKFEKSLYKHWISFVFYFCDSLVSAYGCSYRSRYCVTLGLSHQVRLSAWLQEVGSPPSVWRRVPQMETFPVVRRWTLRTQLCMSKLQFIFFRHLCLVQWLSDEVWTCFCDVCKCEGEIISGWKWTTEWMNIY
jgi:hypothetical protein